ncbi:DUF2380 domain-containing protein [Methylotuvimicrobium sp. KM2]|uniref:DUF2380 domain-containing protein n=1 Tax=Methylotuvimicrobium sp. KM2 TaxID=3133976 RepID=UPI003100E676
MKNRHCNRLIAAFFLMIFATSALAESRIAVLVFELKDLTLAPGIPQELERTASIKPQLEAELTSLGNDIVETDFASQQKSDAGTGYLFDHHDVAAKLGKQFGADYILVGRLHKPSFLFAYIMGHLIRVEDGKLIADYTFEAKGPNQFQTNKTVKTLAKAIDKDLKRLSQSH